MSRKLALLPAHSVRHPCQERLRDVPVTVLHGDCIKVMRTLEAESVDALVSDPPYGIGFMGREWDTFKSGESRASNGLHPNQRIGSENPNLRGRRRAP